MSVRLFYLLNGFAGRSEVLDWSLRLVYVATVPLLATVLIALLAFDPEVDTRRLRWRLLGAAGSVLLLGILTMLATDLIGRVVFHSENFSPRPFITHRVNLLVLQPNDSSFPSSECVLAGGLSVLLLATNGTAGMISLVLVGLMAGARVFCGTDYPVDVLLGTGLGWAWGLLALACWRIPLEVSFTHDNSLRMGPRRLLKVSLTVLFVATCFAHINISVSPYGPTLEKWWEARPAEPTASLDTTYPRVGEGEGMAPAAPLLMAPAAPSAVTSLGVREITGHRTHEEDGMKYRLSKFARPFSLLNVDVAEVKAGTTAYRVAAIRFLLDSSSSRSVSSPQLLAVARNLVIAAVQADHHLRNVDISAVIRPGSRPSIGEVLAYKPVFTASIRREDAIRPLPGDVDPGHWLATRSLLYWDSEYLPALPAAAQATTGQTPPALTGAQP